MWSAPSNTSSTGPCATPDPDLGGAGIDRRAQSVLDVLTGKGLGDLDLAAVAVMAVPLSALPVAARPTVAALSEHP